MIVNDIAGLDYTKGAKKLDTQTEQIEVSEWYCDCLTLTMLHKSLHEINHLHNELKQIFYPSVKLSITNKMDIEPTMLLVMVELNKFRRTSPDDVRFFPDILKEKIDQINEKCNCFGVLVKDFTIAVDIFGALNYEEAFE